MAPVNRFSMAWVRLRSLASCINKSRVFGVRRCLEMSSNMFWSLKDRPEKRVSPPASKRCLRGLAAMSCWKCVVRAFQAGVFGVVGKGLFLVFKVFRVRLVSIYLGDRHFLLASLSNKSQSPARDWFLLFAF